MRQRYTPQLSEENVQRLYRLKQTSGRSMVRLLNEMVEAYFATHEAQMDHITTDRKEQS